MLNGEDSKLIQFNAEVDSKRKSSDQAESNISFDHSPLPRRILNLPDSILNRFQKLTTQI